MSESFALWMNAKYDGDCSECADRITQGDRIVYEGGNGAKRVYCSTCGVDVAGEDPAEQEARVDDTE